MTPEEEGIVNKRSYGGDMDVPVDEAPAPTQVPAKPMTPPTNIGQTTAMDKIAAGTTKVATGAGKIVGKIGTAIKNKHDKNEARRAAEKKAKDDKFESIVAGYMAQGMTRYDAEQAATAKIANDAAAIKAAKKAKTDALINKVAKGLDSEGMGGEIASKSARQPAKTPGATYQSSTSNAMRLIGGGGGSSNSGSNTGLSNAMKLMGGGGGNSSSRPGGSAMDAMRMIGGSGKSQAPSNNKKKGKGGSGGIGNTYGGVRLF